ncbi:MAG: DNA repair protein RecO [Rickettsia endosymbiont of Bryobia graminum]|nr:DNA repair protein RecO [Rickettsia endosymbiont of Bryobia graminum]
MNFKDTGIIIAKKPLKEDSFIITLFTEHHGLFSAVVRGISKKSAFMYHEGNIVDFLWQARLHEHLGTAKCELIKSYSGLLITNKIKLYAFNSINAIIKMAFHEREHHNEFFPIFKKYLASLSENFYLKEYIKFELDILQECGYGLDFSKCVVTGTEENLYYISPKSASAVSLSAGLPYKEKLLPLPQFLLTNIDQISNIDRQNAFNLTGYFFNRYFLNNQQQLTARNKFVECICSL